jgi:hypothetical protein
MRAVIPILHTSVPNSPAYDLCGLGYQVIDQQNLAVSIYINGELVSDTIDFNSSFPTGSNTVLPGIISTVSKNSDSHIEIDIPFTSICQSAYIRVVANKAGWTGVDVTFKVFGYDLGNGFPVTGVNPELYVVMLPEYHYYIDPVTLQIVMVDLRNKCFADFVGWRHPINNQLYLFKNHGRGNGYDYINSTNNENLSKGFNHIEYNLSVKDVKFTVTCNSSNGCGCPCGGGVISTCTSAVKTFELFDPFPKLAITSTCLSNCCENIDCVVEDATLESNFYIEFNTKYLVDGEEKYSSYDSVEVLYELIDVYNNVIQDQLYVVPTTIPFAFSPSDYPFNYTAPEKGDYIIKLTVKTPCYTCTKSILLNTCNPIEIVKLECGKYRVINLSSAPIFVVVDKFLTSTTSEEVSGRQELGPCEYKDYSFNDGIYYFKFYNNSVISTDTYISTCIVHIWCNIEKCIKDAAMWVICSKPDCKCGITKELYNFNALITMAYTYFSIIQTSFNYSTHFTVIDTETITVLHNIQTFMDKFNKICNTCQESYAKINKNCGCK